MVIDGIIISFIVGLLRKGKLDWLSKPLFKWGWIFPVLLLVQVTVFYLQNSVQFIASISNYVFMAVYIIGLFFLWINRDHLGLNIIMAGVFLNFLVMIVNGGRMPVSEEASIILDPVYIDTIKQGLYAKHALITESTNLAFLGDIIPITDPYPKSQVISIGDVIMNIGIFIYIQNKMVSKNQTDKTSYEPHLREVN
ncbi:DUF5317 domain-containing protein [Radiobacillus sp. PE A8.2]|uniref:DUF5317 domain-containing protein n=1 Tax=Radiobacillus sp. PE A8.2 TaxID=3380349 RepID=UPI00388D0FAB